MLCINYIIILSSVLLAGVVYHQRTFWRQSWTLLHTLAITAQILCNGAPRLLHKQHLPHKLDTKVILFPSEVKQKYLFSRSWFSTSWKPYLLSAFLAFVNIPRKTQSLSHFYENLTQICYLYQCLCLRCSLAPIIHQSMQDKHMNSATDLAFCSHCRVLSLMPLKGSQPASPCLEKSLVCGPVNRIFQTVYALCSINILLKMEQCISPWCLSSYLFHFPESIYL